MIQEIKTSETAVYTSPNPLTMICTRDGDGKANMAPVCFFCHLSFNPPMVGFAMGKKAFTGEIVQRTGRAVVAVPGPAAVGDVVRCGTSTGRDCDKTEGMETASVPGTDIPVPKDVRLAMCVSLDKVVEVGDHNLFVCRVDSAYADAEAAGLSAWEGFSKLAPAAPQ